MRKKTALVTGANRGIGLELCTQLVAAGWDVVGACRRSSEALDAVATEVWEGIDVADDAVVGRLAARAGERVFDLLINNAGILQHQALSALDFDSMRAQFEVNSLGPLRVTSALLPNLTEGGKVAIVTSRMGSIDDNTSGGAYGYRMSKAAVNIAGVSLGRDLAGRGISVVLLHPGYVKTDMTRGRGQVDVGTAARGLLARIEELQLSTSGTFFHAQGQELPW
jgi:NAD(P)-dependent dehydrogenase (short-subunit alcohol dehydrogenase family)